jgi:hypothetical protein
VVANKTNKKCSSGHFFHFSCLHLRVDCLYLTSKAKEEAKMYTALVRKKNVPSASGKNVLGYAAITVRDNGTIIVRECSSCTRNPDAQIESLRKNAKQGAKALKCEYKEMLNVTI